MTPRPHQLKMLEGTRAGWRSGFKRQLVVCPTGGGKTPFFAWVAKEFFPGKTLILAHRDELIEQAIDKVWQAIGVRASLEKAENFASLDAQIVVASIQSLCRQDRLERFPQDHFALVVVDETHRILADSYRRILSRFDGQAKVMGVTATPNRADSRNLGEYFDNIACQIPLYTKNGVDGLINVGALVPIEIFQSPIRIDLTKVDVAQDAESGCRDFKKEESAAAIEPYLNEIAHLIKEKASDRRALGFVPLIATAEKAAAACSAVGLRSEFIYGEDPKRNEKKERFANWDYDILWNSQLLSEGFDDPGIDCIIPLRPTKSTSLYCQQVGRGTRLDGPLKRNLLVMDFLWQTEKHKLCRPACLIASSDEESEVITQAIEDRAKGMPADIVEQLPIDLQAVANSTAAKREEVLRRKLEENRKKKGKYISAEEFALLHHNVEIAEFKWHSLPVTEPQQKALRRAKIDPESVRGRGHATALLGLHFSTQKLQLASDKQRKRMRQLGHENWENATAYEARQFFRELRAA